MGCGPSHFGLSFTKKSKKKKNKRKDSDDEKSDASTYENHNEEQMQLTSTPSVNNLCDISEVDDTSPLQHRLSPPQSPTIFVNPQPSSSQLNFFKMLDEKIEMGADYKESIEEQRLERMHRTHALLMEWERARIRNSPKPWSNNISRSLHRTWSPQLNVSNSVIQFDQEHCAFHTELL
ncbi:uncharacterized protein LOC126835633 [Adelges cooleyi]|uniref:uncharacterized protein LOC126835633 n=1 Tax=Adelges cooleyi TaxID=133065 RepID=UPI00217FDA6D|nr:uncharacterized protein LOC126835633 [Adelges cooleyi]